MKEFRAITYLGVALGMLLYAVPRLNVGEGMTMPTIFAVVWIAFALLIIASHLYYLMGVDQEKKQELARLRRFRKWQWEQRLSGRSRMLQVKK